jgi:hypothetical protein
VDLELSWDLVVRINKAGSNVLMFGWPTSVLLALAGDAEDERLATILDDLLVSQSRSQNASGQDGGRKAARPAVVGRDIRPAQGVIARKLTRKLRGRTTGYCNTLVSTWHLSGQGPHAPWRDPARRVGAAREPAAGPARIPGKRQ